MILAIRSHSQGRATENNNRELAGNRAGARSALQTKPLLFNERTLRHPGRTVTAPTMISIIDDDVCAREATAGLIRSLGYAFASYESAEDFLGSDHVNNTSCLITDVHMPGLSGVELYQRLRVDGFAAPTIFVTGHPDETTRTQALATGAVAFLGKPLGKQALVDCLKAAGLHQKKRSATV